MSVEMMSAPKVTGFGGDVCCAPGVPGIISCLSFCFMTCLCLLCSFSKYPSSYCCRSLLCCCDFPLLFVFRSFLGPLPDAFSPVAIGTIVGDTIVTVVGPTICGCAATAVVVVAAAAVTPTIGGAIVGDAYAEGCCFCCWYG